MRTHVSEDEKCGARGDFEHADTRAADYKMPRRTLIPFRPLCWQVVMLPDSCIGVNTLHTSSLRGPVEAEALWHLASICTWALRCGAQISRPPISLLTRDASLALRLPIPTPLPTHPPSPQPVRQNMPFDSRLRPGPQPLKRCAVHDSVPEVAFALRRNCFWLSCGTSLRYKRVVFVCYGTRSSCSFPSNCALLVTVTTTGLNTNSW